MRWPLSVLSALVVGAVTEMAWAQERKPGAADLPTRARTTGQVTFGTGGPIPLELRQMRPRWPLPFEIQVGPGLSGGDPGAGPAAYGADAIQVEIVVPVN